MIKGFFKKNNNLKVKRFLFFLSLASIFWVLTKFSREFTTTMTAAVVYENIPENAMLSEENVRTITFDLSANGFEILLYKIKKPTIDVPVSRYYNKEQDHFTISKNELSRMVASNFNRALAIKNLSVEELHVSLDPIILKKVRVKPLMSLSFKNGFKPIDSVMSIPDSVVISGPSTSLNNINFINTELITQNNVEESISRKVALVKSNNEIVTISPQKVNIKLAVAEFSQEQFTLPIEVINLPPEIELKLVPALVTVSFDVSVNDFSKITKDEFRLVCDYSKRNKNENFLIPQLEKKPNSIQNIVFEPKKIDFFIFK